MNRDEIAAALARAMNGTMSQNEFTELYLDIADRWSSASTEDKHRFFESVYDNRDDLCGSCTHFMPAKNEYWDGVGVCCVKVPSKRHKWRGKVLLTDRYGDPARPIIQFRGTKVFITVALYRCDLHKPKEE